MSRNHSIDMFELSDSNNLPDFEQSLLDHTLNELNATASVDDDNDAAANIQPEERQRWMTTRLSDMSGPAMRTILLVWAAAAESSDAAADEHVVVMYETAALSVWSTWKFQTSLSSGRLGSSKVENMIAACDGDRLLEQFRSTSTSSAEPPSTSAPVPPPTRTVLNKLQLTNDLIARCRRLPAAWTVAQLVKTCNDQYGIQTAAEQLTSDLPVSLTLLRYVRSDLLSGAPLRIVIDAEVEEHVALAAGRTDYVRPADGIAKLAHSLAVRFDTAGGPTRVPAVELERFCDRLRGWFGPWLVLLCGRPRSQRARQTDAIVFATVDRWIGQLEQQHPEREKTYTAQQRVMCCLVGRAAGLLDRARLLVAAYSIADTREQYDELLVLFLTRLPEATTTTTTKATTNQTKRRADDATRDESPPPIDASGVELGYAPVLAGDYDTTVLVVDELLDHVFWEMTVPQLAITRVASVGLLLRLAEHYGDRMLAAPNGAAGVLPIGVGDGLVMANPDRNLPDSEQRLSAVFDVLCPQYRTYYGGKVDGSNDIAGLVAGKLADTNVYVYAGHGNGLQLFGRRQLATMRLHCVAFLYGCSSVALKSSGLQMEPDGAHSYLLYALCPTVFGVLNTTTDVWTDITTLAITSMWLCGPHKHPEAEAVATTTAARAKLLRTIQAGWQSTLVSKSAAYQKAIDALAAASGAGDEFGPRAQLLDVLVQLRCSELLPLGQRMLLVMRGLPVCWAASDA